MEEYLDVHTHIRLECIKLALALSPGDSIIEIAQKIHDFVVNKKG